MTNRCFNPFLGDFANIYIYIKLTCKWNRFKEIFSQKRMPHLLRLHHDPEVVRMEVLHPFRTQWWAVLSPLSRLPQLTLFAQFPTLLMHFHLQFPPKKCENQQNYGIRQLVIIFNDKLHFINFVWFFCYQRILHGICSEN